MAADRAPALVRLFQPDHHQRRSDRVRTQPIGQHCRADGDRRGVHRRGIYPILALVVVRGRLRDRGCSGVSRPAPQCRDVGQGAERRLRRCLRQGAGRSGRDPDRQALPPGTAPHRSSRRGVPDAARAATVVHAHRQPGARRAQHRRRGAAGADDLSGADRLACPGRQFAAAGHAAGAADPGAERTAAKHRKPAPRCAFAARCRSNAARDCRSHRAGRDPPVARPPA